ncbi:hypothetical protein BZG13_14780 [Salinivibrio sp. ML323]|nr:hypothetical protein BZG13_14780 [Salinivibrio sp. ML323]
MPTYANFNVGGAIGDETQAPARCWIDAHCQRAPVTIEVNRWPQCRMAQCNWRQLHCARRKSYQVCTIELALMPTYANFNVGGAIGDRDTSPSTVLDMWKLPTGACHDRG